jgi:hypothetical protein
MIKIKVTCNWSSSEEIMKRLITQFKTSEYDLNGVEFVFNDDYDLRIVFGYITDKIIDSKPTFVFPQEPMWSGSHQKSFEGINNLKVFGFEKSNYNPMSIVIETVSHMFYGGRGPWEEGYDFWNYDNLINYNFTKTKDFCSFVSKNGINDESHPFGCLYGDRVNLINNIHDKVLYMDFYGWGNSGNLKPFALKKGETIKDYKFCLTIENSSENYYISEKFYDCILTNTIPIYYGCKNIRDFWPENGYILLDNISDTDYVINLIENINNNSEEIYNKMLPEIIKMKKRYFDEFNPLKKIKKEIYEL